MLAAVVSADLGWSDIGSWASLYELLPHLSHAKSVGLEGRFGMIGDPPVGQAQLLHGFRNLIRALVAVAPGRVHLQIAAVLADSGTTERGLRQNPSHLRAAQKVSPQFTSSQDIGASPAPLDGLFNGRRSAGLENLVDHACRAGSDAGDPRQRAWIRETPPIRACRPRRRWTCRRVPSCWRG